MEPLPTILLLCTCCFHRVFGAQQFSVRPQDSAVIKGQTAVMRCSIENRAGKVQWAKGIFLLGFDRTIPGWDRYSIIGNNVMQEFNLQIINVNLDDDDDYQCQVGPAPGNAPMMAQAHLQVLVPPNMPEIIDHPNGSVVQIAYTQLMLRLNCTATNARPAAALKWLRNGVEVTDGTIYTVEAIENDKRENARSVLTIRPQYPEDNGAEYACQAKNDALITGPLQVMVTLSVQYPPGEPEITGYKRGEPIRVNDTILLTCTSSGGNPLAQVVWFRNHEQVDFSYKQHDNMAVNKLTFAAQASDNNAEYRCEAWNSVNADTPKISTRTMTVHFPPKRVKITGIKEAKVGETLTLTCTTSNSNPAAVIDWIPRATQPILVTTRTEDSPDGGKITISEIQVTLSNTQSSVMYTCQASNPELGTVVSDTAIVGVLYPPNAPEIFGYKEGDPVRAATLLRMTCRATGGNPRASLAWYKGTEPLAFDNSSSVGNIASAEVAIVTEASDNGAIYKCTAWNKAIDVHVPLEAVKKLTILFPPSGVDITMNPQEPRAGQLLRLTCVAASSNPAASITWLLDDRVIFGSDRGHIPAENGGQLSTNVLAISVTPDDHGSVYGCRAENEILSEVIHDAITLNVLYKPVYSESIVPKQMSIEEGQSRVINLTASANPPNCSYSLERGGTPLSLPGDIYSFSMVGGELTISGISRSDGGNFTVVALNSQGVTSYNFNLDVLYPAEITEANQVEGEAGGNVDMRCVAGAYPMIADMVTWKRDSFDMSRTLQSYSEGVGILHIEALTKHDSGMFTCIADNQIGTPVTRDVELIVKFSPIIDKSQEYTKAASEAGLTGRLICRAEGAPTVTFSWAKDGIPITADGVKYEVQENIADGINYENILLVKDVVPPDYGVYTCIVNNDKGEDTLSIRFDGTTKPDAPYEIVFVNATHNSITLAWKGGFSGGLDQSYRVRYRRVGSTMGYTQVDVQPPSATMFTVRGLELGARYELTVMSYNDIGQSPYQPIGLTAMTSDLKPKPEEEAAGTEPGEDAPVIVILIVCIVGIILLALNIGLILYFVRRRRKRMENGSDTTSHTNTIELYGPSKETALYPMTPSDEARSYGTYDKNDDDFSDDYKSYEHDLRQHKHSSSPGDCICLQVGKHATSKIKDKCCIKAGDDDIKRVFLPPPEYGDVTYSHNKLDSPTFEHRHPVHTQTKQIYSDTDSDRKSPWRYEDPYASRSTPAAQRDKKFEADYAEELREASASGSILEPNGRLPSGHHRPKSVAEHSDRSSRASSRGGQTKTPPPPPMRSSSKGVTDIPPLPSRNYGSQEAMPRYVPPPGGSGSQEPMPRYGPTPGGSSSQPELPPRYVTPPGSMSSFPNNVNVIPNPAYQGPSIRTPSPRQQADLANEMRGHLV